MTTDLDIEANRRTPNYTEREMVGRVLWSLAWPFFRLSPRPCFAWRRALLRLFGARIGREVHVHASTRVYLPWNLEIGDWTAIGEDVLIYNLGLVTIGSKATVSHRAHLCAGTHDHTHRDMPLIKAHIVVGDQAWICADAFVGPAVAVGEGAVVGARAVVMKDVGPWQVVAGNPAVRIGERKLQ
jgi:putative colanic acid biosynthesis acetyltransferase WcaF